jgi:hypothetical protein
MVSVKDRAKMFGSLASPDDAGKDRSYRQIGTIVSSSPFRSTASPHAKFSPSPFSSSSPNASLSAAAAGSRDLFAAFSEDGIPAPSPLRNNSTSTEHNLPPVAASKLSNNSSPFKVLNNQKNQGKLPTFDSSKLSLETKASPLKTLNVLEQGLKPQSTIKADIMKKTENKIDASNLIITNGGKRVTVTVDPPVESNDPSQDSSISNHVEDKLSMNENNQMKPTRAMRLQKARRASSAPIVSKNLKQSLQAANVVMQEEKSDGGASDASTRSSLSNKELSSIAKRALAKSKDKIQLSSSQEARLALLSVTGGMHKRGIENSSASERLGLKASRALAMRNSPRAPTNKNSQDSMDIMKTLSTHSNDTSRSRRMEHPALAGRPMKTNVSSAHMLASFHQFKTQRNSFPMKPKQAVKPSTENQKKDFDDDFEDDDSLRSLEQEDSMHSVRDVPDDSMRSMSGRLGRSSHSRSGSRFSHMGKIHISKNSCNDTVVSSLSGNTQSLQSVPSKMMSPRSKNIPKTSFLLDPMPEDPSQAQRSALVRILSPGPSNRSGHSFANSINSASPRADYRSPSVREHGNASFMDTLEEKHSSSQESAGNSAALLDAALAVAVEDMDIIDSPRTNPSAFSDGFTLQILSSSSNGSSNSPPGFVFKDTEDSDYLVLPDPVGKAFAHASTSISEVIKKFTPSITNFENSDGKIENQEIADAKARLGVQQKKGSTSTKRTVSSSIRSGMSSIQDGVDVEMTNSDLAFGGIGRDMNEGSTSIRTGLSGIQKDSMELSISIHTTIPSEDKETTKIEESDIPRYPDTIEEENDVRSIQKSKLSLKDENTSFSGLKVKPTVTTDGSSGITTGGSTSSGPCGNNSRFHLETSPIDTNGNIVAPIQIESEDMSNNGFSLLSKNGFGKSIGNAIKTVLAKASPRGSGHRSKHEENDEGESLFEDDDDDIFGGLEVEQDEAVVKPKTAGKQKLNDKTPRLKNFMSSEKNDSSISRRTNGSLSQRTNESFSRRISGSLSRRTNQSKSRKSIESGSARKMNTSVKPKKLPKTPSRQHERIGSSPPAVPVVNAASPYTNDRSGMIVDQSEVVHKVNSDITSSLIGGPISGQSPFHKARKEVSNLIDFGVDQKLNEKEVIQEITESEFSKEAMGGSFTKFMEESDSSSAEQKALEMKSESNDEDIMDVPASEDEEEGQRIGDMFLNFGSALVDSCNGFTNLCTQGDKVDDNVGDERLVEDDDCNKKDSASVSSRSELTVLEKKVWNEWDKLSESTLSPKKITRTTDEGKKDNEAQERLLDIGKTESKNSEEFEKTTLFENDQCNKTNFSEGGTLSASGSTEASGNSFDNTLTSGESTLSQDYTRGTYSSNSYSTGDDSDLMSDDPSRATSKATSASGPILLSFSQRSLMEKFSKQLTAVGVQVLKLNTRKQWQTRYFTVSTEQIALSAHEAISKTGEIAQCPKALLWLKKFSPKSGEYGIVNIDKNGHGGMLLVDLVDIQVSERKDDMLENPIPKKLLDRFENSVLVTLKYKMAGILRSIEFRCSDNDEAQFLCTCMRVIRELLRRERSLRQKLSKQVSKKRQSPPSPWRR